MRSTLAAAAAAAVFLIAATPAAAQRNDRQPQPSQPSPLAQQALASGDQPDVLLDVPNLSVEQLTIEVDNLDVELALDARLANLLSLTAGAHARIDNVKIEHSRGSRPGDPDRPARQCPRDHRAHPADPRQQSADRHPAADRRSTIR